MVPHHLKAKFNLLPYVRQKDLVSFIHLTLYERPGRQKEYPIKDYTFSSNTVTNGIFIPCFSRFPFFFPHYHCLVPLGTMNSQTSRS